MQDKLLMNLFPPPHPPNCFGEFINMPVNAVAETGKYRGRGRDRKIQGERGGPHSWIVPGGRAGGWPTRDCIVRTDRQTTWRIGV